jgi:purine-nucleoside phosphorylase
MIWLLSSIIAVETLALAFVTIFAYKNALIILRIQDAIEESLDVLDKRYESISKILKITLFWKLHHSITILLDLESNL